MTSDIAGRALAAAAAVFAAVTAALLPGQVSVMRQNADARKEYMRLDEERTAVQETAEAPGCWAEALEESMKNINRDYAGWIEVPGTGISYPMVRTDSNDDYLRTDFEGKKSEGGTIFIDSRCREGFEGKNTVIYGHRMRDGSMFTDLRELLDTDFCRKTGTVIITSGKYCYTYRVFSVYEAPVNSDFFTCSFPDALEFERWLQEQKARSKVDTGVIPDRSDRVLTLVTCAGDGSRRCVVQAALTKIEEAV